MPWFVCLFSVSGLGLQLAFGIQLTMERTSTEGAHCPFSPILSRDWLWSVSRGTRVAPTLRAQLCREQAEGGNSEGLRPCSPLTSFHTYGKHHVDHPQTLTSVTPGNAPFPSLSLVLSSVMGDECLIGLVPTVLKTSRYALHSVHALQMGSPIPGWLGGWVAH